MVQDIDTESNDFTVVYMDSGWVLEISGIRWDNKTNILHPRRKAMAEVDAYWGVKYSSYICVNNDEATK